MLYYNNTLYNAILYYAILYYNLLYYKVHFFPAAELISKEMEDLEVAEGMPFECWRSRIKNKKQAGDKQVHYQALKCAGDPPIEQIDASPSPPEEQTGGHSVSTRSVTPCPFHRKPLSVGG